MTRKRILTTSIDEEAILKSLKEDQLAACVKIATLPEAAAIHAVVVLLVEQCKRIVIEQATTDPVKLALRHSSEKGRILGVESFIRIMLNAKHELDRRNKVKHE